KAGNRSYELPSFLDTVGRISMIFINVLHKNIDGINIKVLLQKFLDVQKQKDVDPKLKSKYKNILDVAYSTDPDIAKVFINQFDKDPARRNTGAYLNNHLNFLEFQSRLQQKISSKSEQVLIELKPKYFNSIISKK